MQKDGERTRCNQGPWGNKGAAVALMNPQSLGFYVARVCPVVLYVRSQVLNTCQKNLRVSVVGVSNISGTPQQLSRTE